MKKPLLLIAALSLKRGGAAPAAVQDVDTAALRLALLADGAKLDPPPPAPPDDDPAHDGARYSPRAALVRGWKSYSRSRSSCTSSSSTLNRSFTKASSSCTERMRMRTGLLRRAVAFKPPLKSDRSKGILRILLKIGTLKRCTLQCSKAISAAD